MARPPPPPAPPNLPPPPPPPQLYTTGIDSPPDEARERASTIWGVTCVGVTRFRLWHPLRWIGRKPAARLPPAPAAAPLPLFPVLPSPPGTDVALREAGVESLRLFGKASEVRENGHLLCPGGARGGIFSSPSPPLSLPAVVAPLR